MYFLWPMFYRFTLFINAYNIYIYFSQIKYMSENMLCYHELHGFVRKKREKKYSLSRLDNDTE